MFFKTSKIMKSRALAKNGEKQANEQASFEDLCLRDRFGILAKHRQNRVFFEVSQIPKSSDFSQMAENRGPESHPPLKSARRDFPPKNPQTQAKAGVFQNVSGGGGARPPARKGDGFEMCVFA